LYVEMMGGSAPILAKGRELHDEGRYREAQEILNKLLYAEPDNADVKDLLADVFEQLGYQQESPSVRNSFLAAALELRSGIPRGAIPAVTSPDVLRALTTEMFFDYLAIRMDSSKVEDAAFTANVRHPDTGEELVVELSNATLTTQVGFQSDHATVTIVVDRVDFEQVMLGDSTLEELLGSGAVDVDGDMGGLQRLLASLVEFDPLFELLPGTAQP
jgi:alkyl sulfatase BDS1-like metallo-beta-lactamase superfamily hydrolase